VAPSGAAASAASFVGDVEFRSGFVFVEISVEEARAFGKVGHHPLP
jgi:hypothetical protein